MSLFGALSASLTSLTAQSAAVNSISNNISNLDTTGFKSTTVSFSTLVTGNIGGGVLQGSRNNIDEQGAIESTGVGTDLALQGNGFFAVQNVSDNLFFTRAGSFRTDSSGNLVNEAGYKLMGWPLDSSGRLPGDPENTEFTTAQQETDSLEPVSTATITGTASPTTEINAKINLKADQAVQAGAFDTISFAANILNNNNASTGIIVPNDANIVSGTEFIISSAAGSEETFIYGGFSTSYDITATAIGGASNANDAMTGFTDGDAFTITVGSNDAVTFTYNSDPNLDSNEFSTLAQLATVINNNATLTSRVGGDDVLYIASETIGQNIVFADVGTGTLVSDFNFSDVVGSSSVFSTLSQLSQSINSTSDFKATLTGSRLNISNVDPTDTLIFSDSLAGNELLTSFGLDTNEIAAAYDPDSTIAPYKSIASGNIIPAISQTVTVYTSLGESLDLRLAFVRIADESISTGGQTWGVELFAANPDDVIVTGRSDGLVASGEIRFSGDGTLLIKPLSFDEITITPTGGADTLSIALDLGEIGTTDGLSQFAGQNSVDELSQNGFPTGRLQALDIDAQGFVTAIFDNSLTSRVYKLPIATFSNPNGLTPESGNAYSSNNAAGEISLGEVGDAGVGTIVPSALEVSTAEIGNELTSLIIAQQAYSASTNVLRKVTELFEELRNIA